MLKLNAIQERDEERIIEWMEEQNLEVVSFEKLEKSLGVQIEGLSALVRASERFEPVPIRRGHGTSAPGLKLYPAPPVTAAPTALTFRHENGTEVRATVDNFPWLCDLLDMRSEAGWRFVGAEV